MAELLPRERRRRSGGPNAPLASSPGGWRRQRSLTHVRGALANVLVAAFASTALMRALPV